MNFLDLLSDVEGLKGKKLTSIRPGAEIIIDEVDYTNERIILITHDGKRKPRPFSELKGVWERLCTNAAIHVETVVGGSGSSRNQPETILANLPYVEWLKYEGKKHIAFVVHPTHSPGTIKRMDSVTEEETKKQLREGVETTRFSTILVVASDIRQAAESFENVTGVGVEALESGLYKRDHSGSRIFIVSESSMPSTVNPGTYVVIRGTSIPEGAIPIRLADRVLYPLIAGGLNMMVILESA